MLRVVTSVKRKLARCEYLRTCNIIVDLDLLHYIARINISDVKCSFASCQNILACVLADKQN